MDVVEVNRHLKPGKSRFGLHSRKRKTPLPRSGFADGKAQDFFWDGLALIRRGETNITNEPYVTGGNPIIANGTTLFNDILGTTQGATDGKEFSQISRDSFGQTLDNSTDTNYDYFTGKPKIEGLGYTFLFRNYAAGLGKWTTSDPLGYPDGWNNFAYCNNRVTDCFDWLGGEERTTRTDTVGFDVAANCWVKVTIIQSWYEKDEYVLDTEERDRTAINSWTDNNGVIWTRFRYTLYEDRYYEQWLFTRRIKTSSGGIEPPIPTDPTAPDGTPQYPNVPTWNDTNELLDAFASKGWVNAGTKYENLITGHAYYE